MATKYCGYEIWKDISCEDVERLFNFLHANYTNEELVMMDQEQAIAAANKQVKVNTFRRVLYP